MKRLLLLATLLGVFSCDMPQGAMGPAGPAGATGPAGPEGQPGEDRPSIVKVKTGRLDRNDFVVRNDSTYVCVIAQDGLDWESPGLGMLYINVGDDPANASYVPFNDRFCAQFDMCSRVMAMYDYSGEIVQVNCHENYMFFFDPSLGFDVNYKFITVKDGD